MNIKERLEKMINNCKTVTDIYHLDLDFLQPKLRKRHVLCNPIWDTNGPVDKIVGICVRYTNGKRENFMLDIKNFN